MLVKVKAIALQDILAAYNHSISSTSILESLSLKLRGYLYSMLLEMLVFMVSKVI